MKVRISEDLSLPVDVATQTTLVVGKRGSGKSTTAARMVEQLLRAKVPVAILDPVDSWWGLKASRDGTGEGHSVYVFGGRHADLPLEPGAGALIAEFLCEHRAPLVLSCKHLSGVERSRFMVEFAMALFRKWTGGVLHLVLEEAHELAPQNPPKGENAEQMLGAFKRLWKLGRSSGIGGTAITQRPASLHKDITTQSEILVVHRTIGPQDVEAVRQWIKYHHQGEEILPELAHLKTGEAFVWAPEFPEDKPIGLRRVQVLPRETFDSSSTPKHGETRNEPGELAAVDLDKLRTKMAATIERAKADDPKELRKTIADLRKQLAAKPEPATVAAKVVEKAVVTDGQIKRLEALVQRAERVMEGALGFREAFESGANRIKTAIAALRTPERLVPARPLISAASHPADVRARPPRDLRPMGAGDGSLSKAERLILTALAQYPQGRTKVQVAVLTAYAHTGGGFNNALGSLRSRGEIQGSDIIVATDRGLTALGEYEPLPTGPALLDHWRARLSKAERAILEAAAGIYPAALTKEDVAAATGYEASGGGFNNALGKLRTLELITGRGEIRASESLFE